MITPIDKDTLAELASTLEPFQDFDPTIHERNFVSKHDAEEIDIQWSLVNLNIDNPTFKKIRTPVQVWKLFGRNRTGSNGKAILSINMRLPISLDDQRPPGIDPTEASRKYSWIGGEPTFVATPISESPVFLTTKIEAEPIDPQGGHFERGDSVEPVTPLNVNVTVSSWGPDGQKTGNVLFDWTCVCEALDAKYRLPGNGHKEQVDIPGSEERTIDPLDPGPLREKL